MVVFYSSHNAKDELEILKRARVLMLLLLLPMLIREITECDCEGGLMVSEQKYNLHD